MLLTYFGHSVVQIKTGGATLLFDPFITGNPLAKAVTTADALSADAIILTHAHGDHWGDTMEIAKRCDALVVANHEITEYVKKNGHAKVQPMNTGGAFRFEWGTLTQTHARHSSSFPDGTYGGNPNGYILHAEDLYIYNAGDTSPFQEMTWIGSQQTIDLALFPIGDVFTMGITGAMQAARLVEPKLTIPIHFDTFPQIKADTGKWQELMNEIGRDTRVLKPGESLDL